MPDAESTTFIGGEFLLPWGVPVLLLVLLIIFRVRLAELIAEAVHVFRSHLGVLRAGSPLGAAQGLLFSIRNFSVEYDSYALCASGNAVALQGLIRQLLQIDQQICHALEIMPHDFREVFAESVKQIGQLKNEIITAAPCEEGGDAVRKSVLSGLPQVQEILCRKLMPQLDGYCRGRINTDRS